MPLSPSTVDRLLRLRPRPEVVAAAVRLGGSGGWVVTDPVTRDNFELSDEEHAVLTWLDETATLRGVQQEFHRRFAPRRIEAAELWALVHRLHKGGLVVSAGPMQGDELWRRERERRRDERRWAWTRLLAIRLPSFDPDRALTALHGAIGWAMGPMGLIVAAVVALAGLTTAVANAGRLAGDLPDVATLVEPENLVWLAATAVIVKALHELGHALACKHFGGEVREMGVMLLALAPCLYCDVSSMWRSPSRWRRMTVTAAGMGVELLLAAVAVLVWRWSAPGVVQSMALGVIIVCTVGTLLVNANPLLRFDGYYLLADLTGASNLWQRSRDAVRDRLRAWFVKPFSSAEKSTKRPAWWLVGYGLASQAYVAAVVIGVAWLLVATLQPIGLGSVAWAMVAVCLASVAAGPVRQTARWARDPAAAARLRTGRATLAAALLAALAAGVLGAPWSYTVVAPAAAVIDDAEPVVATLGGRLVQAVETGQEVSSGDVVARLVSVDVQRELVQLQGRVAEQELLVDQLQTTRPRDPQAREALPGERATLEDLRRQLADRRGDAERLTLRAPRDGVVISSPNFDSPTDDRSVLPTWTGNPLDEQNRGAWIEPGTLICLIGDPGRVAVQAALAEADIERLRVGQTARVALAQTPGRVLSGKVTEVARDATPPEPQSEPAAALTNWSPLKPPAATPGANYQVRVELDAREARLLAGGAGRVKIDTGRTSLGRWLADGVRQAFRLP